MIDKLNPHYSFTAPPSIHDEEALTALELAGRIGGKVNEIVNDQNALREETEQHMSEQDATLDRAIRNLPSQVEKSVDEHIENGDFDHAIDEYAGMLEARVDNLLGSMTEGSTTLDAEVIDGRVDADGKTHPNIGEAVRIATADHNLRMQGGLYFDAIKHGYTANLNKLSLWEQGHFKNGALGEVMGTGSYYPITIRTPDYIPENVEMITCDYDHRLLIERYKNNAWVDEIECRGSFSDFGSGYRYKVAICRDDNLTPLTPSEGWKKVAFLVGKNGTVAERDFVLACLEARNHGYAMGHNTRSLWEQGMFNDDGTPSIRSDYDLFKSSIRTKGFIDPAIEKLSCSGYWKFLVFRYTKGDHVCEGYDTFSNSDGGAEFSAFDHETYLYKVCFRRMTNANDMTVDLALNLQMMSNPLGESDSTGSGAGTGSGVVSKHFKDRDFGNPPLGSFYVCRSASTTAGDITLNASTSSNEMLYEFQNLVNEHYVGATAYASYMTDLIQSGDYEYDFGVIQLNALDGTQNEGLVKPIPNVFITAGVHGFEKSSVYGLYFLLKDLLENYHDDPVLRYIRHNVNITIMPIVNPHGFTENIYKNGNGVNINRNFPYKWVAVSDKSSDQYGGSSAMSEEETVKVYQYVTMAKPDFVIDFHTNGSGSVDAYSVNWIALCGEQDSYYNRLAMVARRHLASITERFPEMYKSHGITGASSLGYWTGVTTSTGGAGGYLDTFATYAGSLGMTLEGFNGFPQGGTFTKDVFKANAEIIGNFILAIMSEYFRG